jgi:hypothetical protein
MKLPEKITFHRRGKDFEVTPKLIAGPTGSLAYIIGYWSTRNRLVYVDIKLKNAHCYRMTVRDFRLLIGVFDKMPIKGLLQ